MSGLGITPPGRRPDLPHGWLRVQVDGRAVDVPAGTLVAAACERARLESTTGAPGESAGRDMPGDHAAPAAQAPPAPAPAPAPAPGTRRAVGGSWRQAFCGMGVCGECRVTVDGAPHRLGCLVACEAGMRIETDRAARRPDVNAPPRGGDSVPVDAPVEQDVDIAIVGAGPAGLAAAEAAARAAPGSRIAVIDAAPLPGGQVWRATGPVPVGAVHARLAALASHGVVMLSGTRVALALPGRQLLLDHGRHATVLRWRQLVLAGGARERLLPFPGWTLPGVFGAGGLQALAKGGWPVAGRRVVVAGTGPLLMAAAATLRGAGARVLEVAEAAPRAAVARFAGSLLGHPRQGATAARLLWATRGQGVRLTQGWHVQRAEPGDDGGLARVTLAHADGRTRTLDCDALAVGWGLVPQVDLAESLGCALVDVRGDRAVRVGARQRTGVDGVFAAGEATGIAGRDSALAQGAVAGRCAAAALSGGLAAGAPHDASLAPAPTSHARFADQVARTFPAPDGRALARDLPDDTCICRCEDVAWQALRDADDLRAAKLATRCGMGHCQGRLCQDALRRLVPALASPPDATPPRPRPPLSPLPLSHLLALLPPEPSDTPPPIPPTPPEILT